MPYLFNKGFLKSFGIGIPLSMCIENNNKGRQERLDNHLK